jgi:hypothetical protein
MPEKSGLPSVVRGAGPSRFGLPSVVLGTLDVGNAGHCAESGQDAAAKTAITPAVQNDIFIFKEIGLRLGRGSCH